MTPEYYKNEKKYDVIDIANDYKLNFNRGSALKYICRAGKKDNEIQDLKKAIDFLQREVKSLEFEKVLENLDKIANKEIDNDPEGGDGIVIKIDEIKK